MFFLYNEFMRVKLNITYANVIFFFSKILKLSPRSPPKV